MKKVQEEKQKVPAYIVTFSDMVTLLLTFFVMLLSLASVQDPELFNRGRDSFFQSIQYCGLGVLMGKRLSNNLGDVKIRYPTDEQEEPSDERTIDERMEKLRRTFKKIQKKMTTMPSQIVADGINFEVTNIQFGKSKSNLTAQAEKYLADFCIDIKQDPTSASRSLYVLGLAADEARTSKQWTLSAMRAKAVADFLRKKLHGPTTSPNNSSGTNKNWPIFWWGAGKGGNWTGQAGPVPKDAQILIAVLSSE